MRLPSSRFTTLAGLLAMLGVMIVLTSYSVTLYRLFCAATGANGTTQRVAADTATRSARTVTVFFDTSVAPGLPWRFTPLQASVTLHLGEESMAFFEARNLSGHNIVGHATFNVTPAKAGIYFKKIQCFCFTEEKLGAGQTVQMPVTFFVDPRLASDPDTADIDQITLSYTFFESRAPEGATDLARFSTTAPSAQAGQALFTARCAGCHALDRNHVGPALGGVVGRRAGTLANYPYSAALHAAGLVWTPDNLDKWLAGPRRFLPGSQMPMQIDNAQARRDIITYLTTLSHTAPPPTSNISPGGSSTSGPGSTG